MSKYTTELRYVVESKFDIGLKDYPIYKEEYRTVLNKKIIDHYYFREIGLETPALFKFFLNRKMNEIMNYYNQMYKSADIEFNPLWNVEMHETFTHTTTNEGKTTNAIENIASGTTINDGTNSEIGKTIESGTNSENQNNTNSVNSSNENIIVIADTPQSSLNDVDIKAHTYASKTEHEKNNVLNSETNIVDIDRLNTNEIDVTNSSIVNGKVVASDTSNTNGETNVINTHSENYTKLTEGSSAGLPYSDAIKQWRNIMVNIDMLIINELEPLFMQIW